LVLEIWFQDETRIGQKGSRTRTWAEKGTRPIGKVDTRYANAYLFGAFCPAKDLGVALVLPYVNTEGMALHLKEVSKEIPQENHAVMFVDGAAWHRTKKLDMPENITIVILPAYSPEENPAEKVWQYLKDNFLSGRIFDCYEEIVEAIHLSNEGLQFI
jgi:transposase